MVMKNKLLDIIIPVYNAKKTLLKTLCSIALQKNFDDFNVYLVNDCDGLDYEYEINFVRKYYNINIFNLDKNVGPGLARQYGIDHSNSDYIMFIDSDDHLSNPFVLYEIIEVIKNKEYDLINSYFLYQRDDEEKVMKKNNTWLHGKVYKRTFLIDNDIRFNSTRANEDNGFNRLILLCEPKTYHLDMLTYVYSENGDSITRRDNRSYKYTGLKDYCYNINWAISKAISKNKNKRLIAISTYALLYSMYYYYNELYDDYDVSKLFEWSKDTIEYYNKYENLLTDKDKNMIRNVKQKEYEDKNIKFLIDFDTFLKKVSELND